MSAFSAAIRSDYAGRVSRLSDHDGGHRFAEVRIGERDDRGFGDAGQRIDPFLDLLRIDVESAGDNQVLRPADDFQ
jgi:hypothetical protein